ncbi:MAG: glycosyltransferase family 2 protein [Rhodomicrobium sp.]
MPLVSILIPTYNRLQLLSRVLSACIEQAASFRESVEIVVVDNCAKGSAESLVTELSQTSPTPIRYVHEPQIGLATVRNTALRSAHSKYVIFLDDDQLPLQGWLSAFMDAARRGVRAAFGPLEPLFEEPPTRSFHTLTKIFSRAIPADDGDEIGRLYPYLGTGNSLFDKSHCFPDQEAFDARFNLFGGEDVWMLKGLRARNIPFIWVAEARVLEFVPKSRMTFAYLSRRRFKSGQLRVLLSLHPAQRRPVAVLLWMSAGAAQAAFNFSVSLLAWLVWRERMHDFRIKAFGGIGKVFWFFSSPAVALNRKGLETPVSREARESAAGTHG